MVNVIGLGYIGLPTALMMAAHGETVAGTDRNADLVARLNAGQVTFREEGLEELFSQAQAAGITFSAAYQRADYYVLASVRESVSIFSCLPLYTAPGSRPPCPASSMIEYGKVISS